ncbi:MAG: type IV pilus biogenesis/stability protein PilW [Candidatus Thorarchaeota archaeon]
MSFPKRKKYSVKDLLNDLKTIDPTPKITYDVGNRLVYYQWNCCIQSYGDAHVITKNFNELLEFMQRGYELQLVNGEFWRASDTQKVALNNFLKNRPKEFLNFVFDRPPDYIHALLVEAAKNRKQEIKQFKKIESGLRKSLKDAPEDADLWNQLRLVLWIQGKFSDSSSAFQKAKKFGWNTEMTSVVGL